MSNINRYDIETSNRHGISTEWIVEHLNNYSGYWVKYTDILKLINEYEKQINELQNNIINNRYQPVILITT